MLRSISRLKAQTCARGMIAVLPAVSMVLVLVKAAYLAPALAEHGALSFIAELIWNDLPVIGLVTAVSSLPNFTGRLLFRAVASLAAISVVIFHFMDVVLVVTLNARISVRELAEYALEGMVSTGMIWLAAAVAAIVMLLGTSPRLALSRRTAVLVLFSGAALAAAPQAGHRWISRNYGTAIFGREDPLFVGSVPQAERRPSSTNQEFPRPPVDEMIVVMVESLTAADSLRSSGLRNLLPEFDEQSTKGRLFINYFANHQVTEGGLVSLLLGRTPLIANGLSTSLYSRFHGCRSVPAQLKNFGFELRYMSSAPIGFRGADSFVKRIGFDQLRELGREPRFRASGANSFWAAPDHLLFAEALKAVSVLQEQRRPYLLFIETETTHRPYTHPLGLPNSEEEIWRYLDHSLAKFLKELEANGFLSRGLVLIVGDHRKMVPIPLAELERYGEAAAWRVPLLVLGKGVQPGKVDDRLFQAADLFRMLPRMLHHAEPLSSHAVLARRYFPPLLRENRQSLVVVDRALNQYGATVHGSEISWESSEPADRAAAEAEIREAVSFSDGCKPAQP